MKQPKAPAKYHHSPSNIFAYFHQHGCGHNSPSDGGFHFVCFPCSSMVDGNFTKLTKKLPTIWSAPDRGFVLVCQLPPKT